MNAFETTMILRGRRVRLVAFSATTPNPAYVPPASRDMGAEDIETAAPIARPQPSSWNYGGQTLDQVNADWRANFRQDQAGVTNPL